MHCGGIFMSVMPHCRALWFASEKNFCSYNGFDSGQVLIFTQQKHGMLNVYLVLFKGHSGRAALHK